MSNARIIPSLVYRDPRAAIDYLHKAFGLEAHAVYEHEGQIVHAQFVYGTGMIMLGGGSHEGEYGKAIQSPDEADGKVTGSIYMIVDDVDAHFERAELVGVRVITPPEDQSYGGRAYTCRDIEGHIWTFGSYDPWAVTDED